MQLARRTKQILGGSLLASLLVAGTLSPAFAQKTASATSLKIGYFNLQMVKASGTGSDSEALKNQAESQLRRDIEAPFDHRRKRLRHPKGSRRQKD